MSYLSSWPLCVVLSPECVCFFLLLFCFWCYFEILLLTASTSLPPQGWGAATEITEGKQPWLIRSRGSDSLEISPTWTTTDIHKTYPRLLRRTIEGESRGIISEQSPKSFPVRPFQMQIASLECLVTDRLYIWLTNPAYQLNYTHPVVDSLLILRKSNPRSLPRQSDLTSFFSLINLNNVRRIIASICRNR